MQRGQRCSRGCSGYSCADVTVFGTYAALSLRKLLNTYSGEVSRSCGEPLTPAAILFIQSQRLWFCRFENHQLHCAYKSRGSGALEVFLFREEQPLDQSDGLPC